MEWVFSLVPEKRPVLKDPILIEGLPGIGNVGKIAADFLVEKLKAVKLYTIFSYYLPHSVFVNEENLVELPKMEMYYKKSSKGRDLLFLTGDTQPVDEPSCYSFCRKVLSTASEYGCREIITLGGIGLKEAPDEPQLFLTGTSKSIIKKYVKKDINTQLYGSVGPIVGVTGVLVALARLKGQDGITVLGETLGHPMFIGIKTAKTMLSYLCDILNIKLNLKELDAEIETIETELRAVDELEEIQNDKKDARSTKMSYIG